MNHSAMLEACELTAGYGSRPAIHGLSLVLNAGELVGVVGPNGSGKSTLLKALSGLLPAARGHVLIHGKMLMELSPRQRAQQLAMVPAAAQPAFGFSVFDVVSHGLYPHPDPAPGFVLIDAALKRLDLDSLQDSSVCRLSSGEWQRVLIARAMVQNAAVMLLDEPTAHLDVKHQSQVFEVLTDIARAGNKAVMCVCHDLNLASEYCDRLLLLSQGHIAAAGQPHEVIRMDVLELAYGIQPFVSTNPRSGQPVVLPARCPSNQR